MNQFLKTKITNRKELSNIRINNGRELFKIGLKEATEIVSNIIGRKPYLVGEQLTKLYKKKVINEVEKQKEKTNKVQSYNIVKESKYYCRKCKKIIVPPDTSRQPISVCHLEFFNVK